MPVVTDPPGVTRSRPIGQVAAEIPASGTDCVRVAVDGVDAAGKTTFADELAESIRSRGRPVVRVSADDFPIVRRVRHRRGRDSPRGSGGLRTTSA